MKLRKIKVPSEILIGIVNCITGMEYYPGAYGYLDKLIQAIYRNEFLPEKFKDKKRDYSRVLKTIRDYNPSDPESISTTLTTARVQLFYSLYCNKAFNSKSTLQDHWDQMEVKYRAEKGFKDSLSDTIWTVYFIDYKNHEYTYDEGLQLLQGKLTIQKFPEVVFEYHRINKNAPDKWIGRRNLLNEQNNIIKFKLWTAEKHTSKEPLFEIYIPIPFENIEHSKLMEGSYTYVSKSSVAYCGIILFIKEENPIHQPKKLLSIDLFKPSHFSIDYDIRRFFLSRYQNTLQTSDRMIQDEFGLKEWTKKREHLIDRRNLDLFISTPISILGESAFAVQKKMTLLLIKIFNELYGFKKVYSAITNKVLMDDVFRYTNYRTITSAIDKVKRSKRYLYFAPIPFRQSSVDKQQNKRMQLSSSLIELGWVVMDHDLIKSAVLSYDLPPNYLKGLNSHDRLVTFSSSQELQNLDKFSWKEISIYFRNDEIIEFLILLAQLYGVTGITQDMLHDFIKESCSNFEE